MPQHRHETERRIYRLSFARLLPLPVFWGLTVGGLLWLSATAETLQERDAFLLTSGLLTLIFLPFIWIVWSSRLVLTSEGLAHHQFGYTVRSSWQNLETLHLVAGSEALQLKEPGTRSGLLRAAATLMEGRMPVPQQARGGGNLLAEGRLILLTPFMQHWKSGALRADLERHAPHLFEVAGDS